jgi:lipopolysaccharide transport system permease protein
MESTYIKTTPSPASAGHERSRSQVHDSSQYETPFEKPDAPRMNQLLIEAGHTERQYWRDLWRYRELFYFLAWRDLLVRYKQTFVGVGWSLIRPLLTMIVLTVVFGKLGKMPSGGVPYPLLVLCGMLPWQFFSTALSESGNSLVMNSNLISKVYFPRLVIVVSSVITSFVDFLISGFFLVALMIWYRYAPTAAVLFLPLFVLLAFGATLGVGLWIAALMVEYRDFRFIVPFIVQFGLYISPVGFQSSIVPVRFRLLYALNPMVGVIDGFRWCLLGARNGIYWPGLAIAVIDVIVLVASGIWYFRKTEQTFADVI